MKLSIAVKFTLVLTAALVGVFLLQSIFLIERSNSIGRENTINSAGVFASLSTEEMIKDYNIYYDSDFDKYSKMINSLLGQSIGLARIKILKEDGEILFDSKEIVDGKYRSQDGSLRMVPEDEREKTKARLQTLKFTKEDGPEYLEVTNPYIENDGSHYYTVEFYFSFSSLNKNIGEIIRGTATLMFSFCLLVMIFIFLLSHVLIVRPLKKIASAAKSFNEGKFDSEIQIKSNDEIGDLADSLNMTFQDLKKSRSEMEWYAKNLEVKIKARTNALEAKNAEQFKINEKLEQANKLMVGRELRMIELKKEIEKLKNTKKGA